MNNDKYLNIWNYIEPNLSEKIEKEKVIVSMREDSNGEPFIEIIYVNKNGEEISITNNFNNVETIMGLAKNTFSTFRLSHNLPIMSINYSLITKKLHILNEKNWQSLDKDSSICTCFIVDKSADLSQQDKIFVLAQIIDAIMYGVKANQHDKNIIFKVNNRELENVYYVSERFNGYRRLSLSNRRAEENLEIINEEFKLNFTEIPFHQI